MAYLLIDPPVNPLSSPAKIRAWVDELGRWAKEPRYSEPDVHKQIQHAIEEARGWLPEAPAAIPSARASAEHRE
jgi:hypothetical protein